MVRVAHVTEAAVGGVNGIATSIRLLSGELAGLGHESAVLSVGPFSSSGGGSLRSLPTGMGDWRVVMFPRRALLGHLRDRRPDVVHVHTPGPLGAAALALARELGLATVCTHHTDLHGYAEHYRLPGPVIRGGTALYGRHLPRPGNPPYSSLDRRHAAIEAVEARIFDAARVIIVPTAAALRRCRTAAAYAGRVRVVATPPAPPAAPPYDFRRRFGIAPQATVVLYVGRLTPEKGIRLLAEAFAVLRRRRPAVLVLAGPVARRLNLRRFVGPDTLVTGALTPGEVRAAYLGADVFAFPSVTDTQGLVLHEAALAGLPVVMVDAALHAAHPLAGALLLTDPSPAAFAATMLAAAGAPRGPAPPTPDALTPARFARQTLDAYRCALSS